MRFLLVCFFKPKYIWKLQKKGRHLHKKLAIFRNVKDRRRCSERMSSFLQKRVNNSLYLNSKSGKLIQSTNRKKNRKFLVISSELLLLNVLIKTLLGEKTFSPRCFFVFTSSLMFLIVPTPLVGRNCILRRFFFVQTIWTDRYVHSRECE